MNYLDMTDDELLHEIHRVEDLLRGASNRFTIKQNRKYLEKLHRERGKRR